MQYGVAVERNAYDGAVIDTTAVRIEPDGGVYALHLDFDAGPAAVQRPGTPTSVGSPGPADFSPPQI